MSKIGRLIKRMAYSKVTPDGLFQVYFNYKNKRGKNRLLNILKANNSILDLMNEKTQAHWLPRIESVMASADNKALPKHEKAGEIVDGNLIMHNGVKVEPLSYYSYGMLKMLKDNKGIHEPQEEKIFKEVLASLPKSQKRCMLELGAYWSFYSMWFLKEFPDSEAYMVEPDRMNLFYGKANFKLNGLKGNFLQAGIGDQVNREENITNVDAICEQKGIKFLDILHADIQGFEVDMLRGSKKMLSEKRVGYVFVSTHSNELHETCYQILHDEYGLSLVASANLDESFSWDGILVMKMPDYPGVGQVAISRKRSV